MTPQKTQGALSPDDGYPIEPPPGFFLTEPPGPSWEGAKRLARRIWQRLKAVGRRQGNA
jgi:hypothetical protein